MYTIFGFVFRIGIMKIEELRSHYMASEHATKRLQRNVCEQIEHMLSTKGISLGVPLESRIKTLQSIEEKISRKSLEINNLSDIEDLVGFRLILLFKKDEELVCELLRTNFDVIKEEDTAQRLNESQFGYHSRHYIFRIPHSWLEIPTFKDLGDLKFEIQVRTLAQHIWAAASHKLQYKREASVPPPLRRTIHRVSALLETVDLEFDRMLEERAIYINETIISLPSSELLNVDTLKAALDDVLPSKNRSNDENYDLLLSDLKHFSIETSDKLKSLIKDNYRAIMAEEKKQLEIAPEHDFAGTTEARSANGVFFSHMGLTREGLRAQFGSDAVDAYLIEQMTPRKKKRRD